MNFWTGWDSDGKIAGPDNFAGAGALESVAQLADSVTRAGEGDFAEIGLNLGAAGLDLLGTFLDPLGSLATAGIGWLIEHVSFLRQGLDWLAGNGDAIKAAVATWNQVAVQVQDVAEEQRTAVDREVRGWYQSAADGFKQSQSRLADEIEAMSKTCVATAQEIATAGTITAAIRGMIRDLVAMFVFEVIRNAVIALSASYVSLGSSIAAFAAWAVGRGAAVLGKITQYLAKLMRVITRISGRLKGLFSEVSDMLKGLGRFGKGGRSTDAPSTPRVRDTPDTTTTPSRADGVENAGKRLEDWGNARPALGDAATKGKEGLREGWDAYKDAGNTYNRAYADKRPSNAAVDAYAPFKPITRADGGVTPHSVPDVMGGGFQTKFGADVLRETAKQDELEGQLGKDPTPEQKRTFEKIKGSLDL
ncbi:hypothetical protein [Lentzea flaviverrucosa]|uniref:PPE family protein n=1 Tax=Lentzea flaviverrucosa TaxID=200379 RepID=A0A1H9RMJ4_9PSEU|nr:hypothetical protein [Lentzea flaviverrucosa]RDI33071.1 hypothetical protein DFR72_102319 [Lentzea flaviverrucosa]SER73944.1 hypothetical protein SAMN05216195_106320 [Lentzea flaviverrucosa]